VANKNFVVKNGLTVGNLSIDATSGNLATSGNIQTNAVLTDNLLHANGVPYTTSVTVGVIYANNSLGNTYTDVNTIRFDDDSGFDVTQLAPGEIKVGMNSTFKTWVVDGSSNLVAQGLDTVEFIAGNNVTISTNANSTIKSIRFDATGETGYTGSRGEPDGYTGSAGPVGQTGFTGSFGDTGFTGSRGETGYTGSFGDVGYTGSRGEQGIQGVTGEQGTTGYAGSQGIQGNDGIQGTTGYTGSVGEAGAKGDTGYAGSQGAQGNLGDKGDTGYAGSRGATGYDGSVGGTGYTGSQGIQGPVGPSITLKGSVASSTNLPGSGNTVNDAYITSDTGNLWIWNGTAWENVGDIQGPTGLTGPTGYAGSRGDTGYAGSQGNQGDQGNTGFTGSRGFQGDQGERGYTGFTGSRGFQGDQGEKGYAGSRGIQGVQGDQGNTGYTGSRGIQGDKGDKGDQGTTGFAGSKGNTGFVGSQGVPGEFAALGYSGSVGYTGSRGYTGYTGSKGDKGDTGFVGSMGKATNWVLVTSNYTALDRDRLLADTSGGSFIITLPAGPSAGSFVEIADAGNFSVNALTVNRNGATIEDQAVDLQVNIQAVSVQLVHDGTTWQVITTAGLTGNVGYTGSRGNPGGNGYTVVAVSTNTVLTANVKAIVDTDTANITLTLPAIAALGDEVFVIDGTGNSSVHSITIARNGHKIQGLAEDMTVNTNRAAFGLTYYNSNQGWLLNNV